MGPVPSHQVLADAFERQRRRRARDRVVAVPAGAPRRPQGAGPARRAGAFPSSNLLGGGSQPPPAPPSAAAGGGAAPWPASP